MDTLNAANRYFYFGMICFVAMLYALLINIYYLNYDIIHQTYITQLSDDNVAAVLETSKRWAWISLLFLPLVIISRVLYTAVCLSIGGILKSDEAAFMKYFNISLKAEAVFALMLLTKLFIFGCIRMPADLIELNIIPFSLYDLLKQHHLEKWQLYPLQTINIWEVFYALLLAKLLSYNNSKPFLSNLLFVCCTYGVGLLIWLLIIVFFTVSIQ
ncbi:hypothetical protein [Chitinophaga sp. Cy-1792]|uniref:hypothetical protein n=1 Tax=Chitinophaga sp. Cy-1792 TaxID=2608339 RepID=UPI001422E335|nr:hypothetical protein [Chitinophaga sp. Cy-1792]NIG54892.1 hypothetical protein [Chitinophaga sp. Cy-1792]